MKLNAIIIIIGCCLGNISILNAQSKTKKYSTAKNGVTKKIPTTKSRSNATQKPKPKTIVATKTKTATTTIKSAPTTTNIVTSESIGNNMEIIHESNTSNTNTVKQIRGTHMTKTTTMLNLGIGYTKYGFPIHANIEKIIIPDIGLAINGTYEWDLTTILVPGGEITQNIDAGLKCNYYFNNLLGNKNKRYHLYAGAHGAYWFSINGNPAIGITKSGFLAGVQIGTRIFIGKRFAFYAEAMHKKIFQGHIGLTIKSKR
jgi:hypothetical protein